MERKILAWLTILAILALILGYLMTQKTTVTTTTTTLPGITTTSLPPTTTRLITRPTQPTTTKIGATTLQTTTTSPYGASTTTTTLINTGNNTAGSTTTTHPDIPDDTTATTTATTSATTATTTATTSATTQATTATTTATTVATTQATTATTTATTTTTLTQLSTPALYLKFDEVAGSTAYDSSVGGNDATLMNGPIWTTGRTGNALRLDGTNDYAHIGITSNLDFYQSLTIAAWVKPTTVTREQDIVCRNWQTGYAGYEFGLAPTGELMFRINPTASSYAYRTSSGAAVAANVWQHVAVTYDGTNIRFYKNGALVRTVAAGGRLYPETSDIFIGIYPSRAHYQFSGLIDELQIYDKSLSAAEISQIYVNAPAATTTTTLQGATTTTNPTTTTSTTTKTTTTVATTTTTSTTLASSCRVGPGYTFTSTGTYTANSASGVASISRSGQYTFYETPHNYGNNLNCQWSGTYTCPAGTNIRFYVRAQTESGYDYFNIRNSAAATYETINGDAGTSYYWSTTYNQRAAAFNFISDESNVNWGVDLYQIDCVTPTTTTTTTTRATTTTTLSGGECFGAEDCNPTGSPIGGGAGYQRIVTSGNKIVTTTSQFISALSTARSGDVIFIPGTVTIDLTGYYALEVPAGVTIASDRGYAGSLGGRIYRNHVGDTDTVYAHIPTFNVGGNNVRFTGLRIEGTDVKQDECFEKWGDPPSWDPNCATPLPSQELAVRSAIHSNGYDNLEVDNCEIWGWSWNGIQFGGGSRNGYVHHNYIHHCQARGYGYGVAHTDGSQSIIEANKFDYTRHAIMSSGCEDDEYEARYNVHLGHGNAYGGHHFDIHGCDSVAGGTTKIHHNTFYGTELYAIGVRGRPAVGCYIDHNIVEKYFGFQRSPYGNVFITKNYIEGVFEATSQLDHE